MNIIPRIVGLMSLVIVAHCARASDLPTPKMELAFDTALALDMSTTLDIRKHPGYVETNTLLGSHPSDAKVIVYGAVMGTLHYLVTRELVNENVPMPVIQGWEVLTTAVEIGYTAHNYSIGLHARF